MMKKTQNKPQNVAIFGLGWLGMPLAIHLQHKGWQVIGTKRTLPQSPTTVNTLPFELTDIERQDQPFIETPLAPLFAQEKWIITLPPNTLNGEAYVKYIKRLVSIGILHRLRHLIFISSTGVFPAQTGLFDEHSATDLTQPTAQLEKWLERLPIECDIIRLAGLVGENRHPVRYLAGKQALTGANQPVNLVHLQDAIRGIEYVLKTPNAQRIFHLCAPHHPTREHFYRTMAEQLGLAMPHFLPDNQPLVRLISGEKICQTLGFEYQFPDPFLMPINPMP